jgi:hypothetical protein
LVRQLLQVLSDAARSLKNDLAREHAGEGVYLVSNSVKAVKTLAGTDNRVTGTDPAANGTDDSDKGTYFVY